LDDFFPDEDTLVSFHTENADFQLDNAPDVIQWIEDTVRRRNCELVQLTYVFCSDDYLHQINIKYLEHDTLTDIITFPYAAPPQVEGDIFISIDRIKDNAQYYKVPFVQELHRVIIHGVLHLCGQGDKTAAEAAQMRQLEEEALLRFSASA